MNDDLWRLLAPSGKTFKVEAFHALLDLMRTIELTEQEKFSKLLARMPYPQFLSTCYWGIIRGFVVGVSPFCVSCGEREGLQLHHKTYAHRGSEWKHMFDLALLCKNCHAYAHSITSAKQIRDRIEPHEPWVYPDEARSIAFSKLKQRMDEESEDQAITDKAVEECPSLGAAARKFKRSGLW